MPAGADGYGWIERISSFCQGNLNHTLEKLFDRYASAEELIRIDKLLVDTGNIHSTVSDDDLAVMIGNRLEEQLYSLIVLKSSFLNGEAIHIKRLPAVEEIFDQWLYYLVYGLMPWQAGQKNEDELKEIVLGSLATSTSAVKKLQLLLTGNARSAERLILQNNDEFLILLLEAYTENKQQCLKQLLKDLLILQNRWMQHIVHSQDRMSYIYTDQSLRVRFWRYVVRLYMTGNSNEISTDFIIQNNHAGGLIADLFMRRQYPGMADFMMRELRKSVNTYPALSGLSHEVVKQIIKRTIAKDISGKSPLNGKIHLVEEEMPSEAGTQQEHSTRPSVETGQDEKSIAGIQLHNTGEPLSMDSFDSSETDSFLSEKPESLINEESFKANRPLSDSVKEGEGIYVHNAGIVLLNPFFAGYFRKVGLVTNDDFFNHEARQRGVHIIQYMATGKTVLPEHEMLLAKLLCGLQIEDPVERFIELSEVELDEVEFMMQSVIEHWGAVGKASPDGLREGFFQRDGKLEKREDGWNLKVERKTIDILLDRLPLGWGYGTIKLPWMKEILHVEW